MPKTATAAPGDDWNQHFKELVEQHSRDITHLWTRVPWFTSTEVETQTLEGFRRLFGERRPE